MGMAILAGLAVIAIGAAAILVVCLLIAAGDRFSSRGWGSDEREASGVPAPASRSSDSPPQTITELCACGEPHPAEFMPLELLIAGDVPVSPGRWFGPGRRA